MIKYKNIIRYGAFFAFFAVSVGFSVITNPATTFADDPPASDQSSDITCAIEKMGWILCPIIETSGKVGDQAFNFLANNFLQTEPELISNSPSGTKAAWQIAVNLANIMFIIALLIIILSQVTGQGLNNYGIKKMLPRLFIAAIAVNLSYYICQLIVDVTNILGFEIQRFMIDQAHKVSDKAVLPVPTGFFSTQTSGGALGAMASGILGIPTIVWFLLPMLFLGITTVVITCIVIVVILLLRKAFIILLVVISPIAFVAYILPNTEKFFQKWGRMFWQLLLVFPIVSLLFGSGQLASAVILAAGSNSNAYKDDQSSNGKCIQLPKSTTIDYNGNTSGNGGRIGWWGSTLTGDKTPEKNIAEVKDCVRGSTPFLLGITAAGIAVAPMLAVWAVLKGALSAAGSIGGKISGAVQNAGNKTNSLARKPEDALRRAAIGAAKTGLTASALEGGFGKRTARFVGRRRTAKARQDSRIKAAQAGFDATLGADSAMQIAANNQAAAAADAGLREQFVQAQLKNPNMVSSALSPVVAQEDSVKKALDAQQTQALAAAVKDFELNIDPRDLDKMQVEFDKAMESGNKIEARAYANSLLQAGGTGQTKFKEVIGNGTGHDINMINDVKTNLVSNNGNALAQDQALKKWGLRVRTEAEIANNDFSANDLAAINNDSSTYSGLTAEKYANLSSDSQIQAAAVLKRDGLQGLLADRLQAAPNQLARVDDAARKDLGLATGQTNQSSPPTNQPSP